MEVVIEKIIITLQVLEDSVLKYMASEIDYIRED